MALAVLLLQYKNLWGGQPISLFGADFNNDGLLDIVTTNNGARVVQLVPGSPILVRQYTVSVLINQGRGIFADQVQYEVGPNPVQVIAEDLNGDGFSDLVVANHVVAGAPAPNPSWVSVLMNLGAGTFTPEIQVATDQFPNSVEAADLNNDGRTDLVTVSDYTPGIFSVSTQNPNGSFAPFATHSPAVMNAPNVVLVDDLTMMEIWICLHRAKIRMILRCC